jgi:putative phosphoribosyl transferase
MNRLFRDRRDAGEWLARSLKMNHHCSDVIVLGLPRGGVPVAFEIARALNVPLDVFVTRALTAPDDANRELGAIGSDGLVYFDDLGTRGVPLTSNALDEVIREQRQLLEEELKLYRGQQEPIPVEGKTVIVIDEGMETGSSMRRALHVLRLKNPHRVVAAVPVAPAAIWLSLQGLADDVVCLKAAETIHNIDAFYVNFEEVNAADVEHLLDDARRSIR